MREVIIPSVQTFLREDWPYGRVMADLARRTVEQHLRISWTRMAADPRRDVALLTSDGERWSYRKVFKAGRTASRIYQAAGWLRQLGLVDERGLTADGRAALTRSMDTDILVWKGVDTLSVALAVQCKDFTVKEHELGNDQIRQCLKSISDFRESGIRADT